MLRKKINENSFTDLIRLSSISMLSPLFSNICSILFQQSWNLSFHEIPMRRAPHVPHSRSGVTSAVTRRESTESMGADVSAKKGALAWMNADVKSHCCASIWNNKHSCFAFFADFAVKSAIYLCTF